MTGDVESSIKVSGEAEHIVWGVKPCMNQQNILNNEKGLILHQYLNVEQLEGIVGMLPGKP